MRVDLINEEQAAIDAMDVARELFCDDTVNEVRRIIAHALKAGHDITKVIVDVENETIAVHAQPIILN